jgi:hypothetical protein
MSASPEPPADTRDRPNVEPTRGRERAVLIVGLVVLLGLAAAMVVAVSAMLRNPAETETIRDIFIIFMAFETLVIGLALILLIVQLARLTNLIQNEVRPILESTNETVSTLRGTTRFLSDNLVQPVVKANSLAAALRRMLDLARGDRHH